MKSPDLQSTIERLEALKEKAPEHIEDERKEPTPEELWQTRLERCSVPKRFRLAVPHETEPLEFEGWSFVLYGKVGAGKTYQAVAILGHQKGSGLFVDCAVAVELMKQEFDGHEGPRLIQRMIDCTTLVLDDFGAERLDSEFARDAFATVIRARYNEMRTTIITTNLDPDQGELSLKRLHPPLYSRLREGAMVRLKGRDRRAE